MTCKTSGYSVYFDGGLDIYFRRKYRGVIVNAHNYPDGGHLAIRKPSVRIFGKMFPKNWVMMKCRGEMLYEIRFDDESRTIELVMDKVNPTPGKMRFGRDTYEDLKKNMPEFLRDVGYNFEIWSGDGLTLLDFRKGGEN